MREKRSSAVAGPESVSKNIDLLGIHRMRSLLSTHLQAREVPTVSLGCCHPATSRLIRHVGKIRLNLYHSISRSWTGSFQVEIDDKCW